MNEITTGSQVFGVGSRGDGGGGRQLIQSLKHTYQTPAKTVSLKNWKMLSPTSVVHEKMPGKQACRHQP